jgi:hypothetical protein
MQMPVTEIYILFAGLLFFIVSPIAALYSYYNGGSGAGCFAGGVLGTMIGIGLLAGCMV